MPTFRYLHDGRSYAVSLERDGDGYAATIDGRAYRLNAATFGVDGLRLTFDETSSAAAVVAAEGDARHVWIDGAQITLRVADETAARARGAGRRGASRVADKRIVAAMPGQVRAVAVNAGDTVTAGQTLVVLEAMKMEVRAVAPADGVVARVAVSVGDVVERGATLVDLA